MFYFVVFHAAGKTCDFQGHVSVHPMAVSRRDAASAGSLLLRGLPVLACLPQPPGWGLD